MSEQVLNDWATAKLSTLNRTGVQRRCESFELPQRDGVEHLPGSGQLVRSADGRALLNFGSNDYLGLSQHPVVIAAAEAALRGQGSGVGASRVVSGTRPHHERLERRIGEWLGKESALLFGSGYLANVGVVSALCGRHDAIVADRLIHASLLDGITLSGAKLFRFQHNDCDDLAEQLARAIRVSKRIAVVTESVFSMDGDVAPMEPLLQVAERFGAFVIVDEAHALGVFGNRGSGLLNATQREQVAIITGTMSKACGSYGGFVACSAAVRELLVSTARSFLFSTGLPAASAAAADAAIAMIMDGSVDGSVLLTRAAQLRVALGELGFDTRNSSSHVVPIVLGSNEQVLRAAALLQTAGLFVPAIRHPTVPKGSERLRISLNLTIAEAQLALLVAEASKLRGSG